MASYKYNSEKFDSCLNTYREIFIDPIKDENTFNGSVILPLDFSLEMDGLSGIIPHSAFTIPANSLPTSYIIQKGDDKGKPKIAFILHTIEQNFNSNKWTTKITGQTLNIRFEPLTEEEKKARQILKNNQRNSLQYYADIVSTATFNKENLRIAVQFFLNKGYSDYKVAALIGGFLQESQLDPAVVNSIGAVGIAQWLGDRKNKLIQKSNPKDLQTQLNFVIDEFNTTEKSAYNSLIGASNLDEAVEAAAQYERFNRQTEWGNRIGYAKDLLARIKAGEFGAVPDQALPLHERIVNKIKQSSGGGGTNEEKLVSAIKMIDNKNTFNKVNQTLNIQYLLNDELGIGDQDYAISIQSHLKTLGINLTFDTNRSNIYNSIQVENFKITF